MLVCRGIKTEELNITEDEILYHMLVCRGIKTGCTTRNNQTTLYHMLVCRGIKTDKKKIFCAFSTQNLKIK
jgi:hypothetical protein